jgi:glutamate carboxypeptidase
MRALIESRYDQFIKDLETLVNIDSGSGDASGLMAVADFFQQRFGCLGWPTRLVQFAGGSVPCLEIVNRAIEEAGRFDFLFLGHMDTVFPKGTVSRRPFSIRQGRAFGPGVCDMKAGLVTALHVAEALAHSDLSPSLSICIAFNSDEEVGSKASQKWLEGLAARSQRVLVLEPCRPAGQRVLERKGVSFFEIICNGRSAHAGVEPEKGANAVLELSRLVIEAAGFQRLDVGTTVNVTRVSGGSAQNVIPNRAQSTFDVRFSSMAEMRRVSTAFRELSRSEQTEGVHVLVEEDINRPPMVPSEATLKLWEAVSRIGRRLGLGMNLVSTGGGSDGNFTAAMDVPTIDAMGPQGGNAHTDQEYLLLDSVSPNTLFVCEIMRAAARGELP